MGWMMDRLNHCDMINTLTGLKMASGSKVSSTITGHCGTEETDLSLRALLPTVVWC